jgi:hypothetical protein
MSYPIPSTVKPIMDIVDDSISGPSGKVASECDTTPYLYLRRTEVRRYNKQKQETALGENPPNPILDQPINALLQFLLSVSNPVLDNTVLRKHRIKSAPQPAILAHWHSALRGGVRLD